jgi:hypothetical protein
LATICSRIALVFLLACRSQNAALPAGSSAQSIAQEPTAPVVLQSAAPIASQATDLRALSPTEPVAADDVQDEPWWALEITYRIQYTLGPPPADLPVIESARVAAEKASESSLVVTLAAGRARFVFDDGTELRADARYAGLLLVEPQKKVFHVVSRGALRSLFGERRLDVLPPLVGQMDGKDTLRTPFGDVTFVQSTLPAPQALNASTALSSTVLRAAQNKDKDAASEMVSIRPIDRAGTLVCRFFVEWISADWVDGPCAPDTVPMSARFRFKRGGGLTFESTAIRERTVASNLLMFPPPDAQFSDALPAAIASHVWLSQSQSLALRAQGEANALSVTNDGSRPKMAWIDGVPAALLAAGDTRSIALRTGKYALEWRTMLSEPLGPVQIVAVPGGK